MFLHPITTHPGGIKNLKSSVISAKEFGMWPELDFKSQHTIKQELYFEREKCLLLQNENKFLMTELMKYREIEEKQIRNKKEYRIQGVQTTKVLLRDCGIEVDLIPPPPEKPEVFHAAIGDGNVYILPQCEECLNVYIYIFIYIYIAEKTISKYPL